MLAIMPSWRYSRYLGSLNLIKFSSHKLIIDAFTIGFTTEIDRCISYRQMSSNSNLISPAVNFSNYKFRNKLILLLHPKRLILPP